MPTVRPPPPPPVVQAYVTTSFSQAQAWQARVDAALGYPKYGKNVGAGVWADDPLPFLTTNYADIFVHPTATKWAYPSDSLTDPILVGAAGLPKSTQLDATWFPGTAGTPAISRRVFAFAAAAAAAIATGAGLALAPAHPSDIPSTDAGVAAEDAEKGPR